MRHDSYVADTGIEYFFVFLQKNKKIFNPLLQKSINMEKQAALNRIQNEVNDLIASVENVPETLFFQQPHPEKWSVGQNIQHLFQSSKPLVGLFGKPESMEQFGRSPRSSYSYEEVATRYKTALQTPPPFLLAYRHLDTEGSKADMLANYRSLTAKLLERAALFSEADLDSYQIPHPLLGLLTVREFLHFTAFHTRHHHDIIGKLVIGELV